MSCGELSLVYHMILYLLKESQIGIRLSKTSLNFKLW